MKKLLWIVILISLLIGCAPEPEVTPLTLAIIPAGEPVLSREQFAPFVKYLSQELSHEVRLFVVPDYAAVVEAMKYGWADIARFGSFSYVMATEQVDVEAVAVGVKKKSGEPDYRALIVARADSNITDLNGKTFAFVDVGSTSGWLAPTTYLKQEGVELGEVFYAGSHPAVIEAVKNGSVDAGAIADNRYKFAVEEGVIAEGEFVVFWESDPIPVGPIAVHKSMDAELKEALVQALLNVPMEVVEVMGLDESGYVRATDEYYDFVREMAKNK